MAENHQPRSKSTIGPYSVNGIPSDSVEHPTENKYLLKFMGRARRLAASLHPLQWLIEIRFADLRGGGKCDT
jgi:hypothetical protein